MIVIRPFRSPDAAIVSVLNRAWLEAYALLEPADEHFLADPEGDIIGAGGAIWVAADEEQVLGTVAMLPTGPGRFELLKLTVAPQARGRGVGRQLVDTALAFGRAHGAVLVTLVSNSQLTSALRIYEQAGFEHRPLPPDLPYKTADRYMELVLASPPPSAS